MPEVKDIIREVLSEDRAIVTAINTNGDSESLIYDPRSNYDTEKATRDVVEKVSK